MQGRLGIEVIAVRSKKVERRIETKNLVVNQGYAEINAALAGVLAATHYVSHMSFGTSSGAPTLVDENLGMPITPSKAIATYTYPDVGTPYSVVFEAYLLAAEANGFALAEAGLITSENVMIARALFPTLSKDSDHIFHFTWTVSS